MNDDILTLYYYDDGLADDERAAVEAALESDESLRERYRALCRSLELLSEFPDDAPPPAAVRRWHGTLERVAGRARAGKTVPAWHLPSFAWGALAATLVLGICGALYLLGPTTGAPMLPQVADDETDAPLNGTSATESPLAMPASFSRGLKVHLRQSRLDLLQLPANGNDDRAMLVLDILRQNRLFERVAQENNAEDVARVLRAFEPVLMRLAMEDLSDKDAAALRAKLAFELNVMLTKMSRRESDDSQTI